MFKFFIFFVICLPIITTGKQAGPFIDVVLNEIQTENYAKDIVTIFEVHLVPFNGHRAISGAFKYQQAIPDMFIQITMTFEKPDKTRFKMMDIMVNACSFLNGTNNKLKIPQLILKELKKQQALPKQCPFEANKTFTWENFEFQVPKFPLPNLKFICGVMLYKGDKKQKLVYVALKGATKRI